MSEPGAARIPEGEQLLKAVDEIAPVIRDLAPQAETLGHLPPPLADALDDAGIFRMMWPREVGGYEADPVTQHEVIDRLSYHDPSTGWCGFIGAGTSAFVAAHIPDDGLEEVQASAPAGRQWVRFAGAPAPQGRAVPVDGGWRVSGRWAWASGIHHSQWVLAGAVLLRNGEPTLTETGMPESLAFAIPLSDVQIEDTWHVSGLKGTGSAHFNTEDCFVPDHRALPFLAPVRQRGGALFGLPVLGFFGPAFSGFPQGVGRRALDEIRALSATKVRLMAGRPLAERGVFQRDLAVAHDRLRAAGLLVRQELAALWERLHSGTAATPVAEAQLLSAFTGNSDASVDAVEMAYRYGGGDSVYQSSPLQQLLRDVRTAAQHMLVGEQNYEALGRALLGA